MYTSEFTNNSYYNNIEVYYIMNKDIEIAKFSLEEVSIGDIVDYNYELIKVDDKYKSLIGDVRNFISSRKPVKNREYLQDLVSKCGLNNDKSYIQLTKCLSLNDTLWVKLESDTISWEKINLYNNPFNEVISKFAFTGEGLYVIRMITTSPEYGTNGMLPKCWKRYQDGVYLLKSGTSGASNTGREPYSEYYACQILKVMGIMDYVDYDLVKYHGRIASKCKIFTSEKLGYRPMSVQMNIRQGKGKLVLLRDYSVYEEYRKIILFDSIICNPDRHLNNYGFLVNNDTMKIIKIAPIFDNGLGLVPYWTEDKDIIEYANKMSHNDGTSFIEEGRKCILNIYYKNMVKKLINFKFKKHPLYNLDDNRLKQLERLIQHQVREILKN